MRKRILVLSLLLITVSSLGFYFLPEATEAATGTEQAVDILKKIGAPTGLAPASGESDLPRMVARVINIILGLLGIIAVIYIIYGGFKWMTAAGNEQEVSQAKNIIRGAITGLLVVLLSYVIINFVVIQLIGALGNGAGSTLPINTARPTPG